MTTREVSSFKPLSAPFFAARSSWIAVGLARTRANERTGSWTVAAICAFAFALRALVVYDSFGTNDISTWFRFALLAKQYGVLRVYELDRWFNHPPLMGLYGTSVLEVANALSANFVPVFKVVPIIASTISVYLVHRIGRLNAFWLLLFAINPADVLISAYHGNTDPVCVMFCLACVLFANRRQPWLSGLCLGAALNVKLIPVVLIAPMALSFTRRDSMRFFLGLGLGALPFVPVYLGPWLAFRQNAIEYNSFPSQWGFGLITSALDGRLGIYGLDFSLFVLAIGKPLILGASVLLGLVRWRYGVFSRAELCALALTCFLVFAPGFGVQYLLYPTAFFTVALAGRGLQYVYLASAFTLAIYYGYWTGSMPAFSDFNHAWDLRMVLTGFLCWIWLGRYLVTAIQRVLALSDEWKRLVSAA